MSWDKDHWEYHFGNESKEIASSFWKTVIESPQWKGWVKEAYSKGFDYDESQECGWLSQKHFQAFMDFCTSAERQRREEAEITLAHYADKRNWRCAECLAEIEHVGHTLDFYQWEDASDIARKHFEKWSVDAQDPAQGRA